MDTFERATLARVHSQLFNDLNEIGRLGLGQGFDGVYDAAESAHAHLRALEGLADPDKRPEANGDNAPKGLIGLFPEDTLANVCDTRSLILYPASTTHCQLTEEQQRPPAPAPTWSASPSASKPSKI